MPGAEPRSEKRAAKGKRKRVSFIQRFRNEIHELTELGREIVHEPRSSPGTLLAFFKGSVRKLWRARGGGFYACGFVVTFVCLELKTIVTEIVASDSALGFVTHQLFEMLFRLLSQSFVNTLLAFVWPAFVLEWSPTWGIVILAALYFAFPRLIKPALTRWLFDDEEGARETEDDTGKNDSGVSPGG